MKMNLNRQMPAVTAIAICLMLASCSSSLHLPEESSNINAEPTNMYLRLNEINRFAANDLIKRFSDAEDEKWLKTNRGYLAKFTSNNVKSSAYYDKQGRFIEAVQHYNEENMPFEIKNLVTKKYPGHSIIVTTAIQTNDLSFYRINIKNCNEVLTLKVSGSAIEVLELMKNGETNYYR